MSFKSGTDLIAEAKTRIREVTITQVQQQLGAQALSIANQSPQVLLSLFRS